MTLPVHTVEFPAGSLGPQKMDRVMIWSGQIAVQPSASSVTAIGAITAGTGFTSLPQIAPTGGTLTAGVTPASPAVVRATSLKVVGTPTVVAPGLGVAISDTFNLNGTTSVLGPSGNTTSTNGVPAKVTVTDIQVATAVVNNAGTGGTPGPVTITGTTGTGTKWQGTATINSSGNLVGPVVVTVGGDYTVTPTIAGDAITGGSLTSATCTLVMGAKTLSLTTAGSYTMPPLAAGATTTNVVGTGTGVTVASTCGLASAIIEESGNYSAPPSFVVTPNDGNGTGASIATGSLGGAGLPVFKQVPCDGINNMTTANVQATGNINCDAVPELLSQVGGVGAANNPNNSMGYVSFAIQPRLAANLVTQGTFNCLVIA